MTSKGDLDDVELAGLTDEQLEELAEFIDPDNELLPPSERLPPQTKKKATGPYDRKHLLNHLKSQAEKSTIGDDYVPFVKKHKPPPKETKVAKPKPKVASEFDDMLDMLDAEDLTELASELGIHSILDQSQSRGDERPVASASTGLHKPRTTSYTSYSASSSAKFEEEDPQETDIEESIAAIEADDPDLRELNLNNHHQMDAAMIEELIRALKDNSQLQKLQMSNVKFSEDHAIAFADVLRTNTSLVVLNLESNRITRRGIRALMKGLSENPNTSLKELRLANQYFSGGAGAEGEIAKYLEKNKTLTKLGYNFTQPSFRTKVDGFIMRNTDFARKKRASLTC